MGRFDIDETTAAEWDEKFKDAVRPKIDEDVLAVGQFRQTGAATRMGISKGQLGALAYAGSRLTSKKRAGGLPSSFMLAVTPTKVHAFKYKQGRKGPNLKEEVAVWDRSGLKASSERLRTTTRLTLESPAEGEKVVCDAEGIGQNPWADAVIELLQRGPQAGA
jgi:hypothetical protein